MNEPGVGESYMRAASMAAASVVLMDTVMDMVMDEVMDDAYSDGCCRQHDARLYRTCMTYSTSASGPWNDLVVRMLSE